MKKAFAFLEAKGVDYHFHDYKKDGIEAGHLERWIDRSGWEAVLNSAGTTFRKLPDCDRVGLDRQKALALMLARPSMIKRPVLEKGDDLIIGFKPDIFEAAFIAS